MTAVPNLWVATPRGVAMDFHWGRHCSSDILQNPCTVRNVPIPTSLGKFLYSNFVKSMGWE